MIVSWRRSASVRGAVGVISGEAGGCSLVPSVATALNSLSRPQAVGQARAGDHR